MNAEGTILFDVAVYWRLLLKHKFLVGGLTAAAALLSIVVSLLTTPTYTATTTLQIDREAARVLKVEDASSESLIPGQEFILTQYGLLKARSLAERVAQSEGFLTSNQFLDVMGVEFERADGESSAQVGARRREMVTSLLQTNLKVIPIGGSRLVEIAFDSPNPQLSAQVANAFARNFIATNLERKFDSTSYARQFLEERIAQTKSKLEDTERQLVRYAVDQQIINIESETPGGVPQALTSRTLVTINAALAAATSARINAEQRWRRASASPVMTLTEVQQNPTIQRLGEERAKLAAQYEQNLGIYQPSFPTMVQLKAQIDEIDGQIQALANEVREAIRSEYVVAENQERALKAEVNGLQGDVLGLRNRSIQYNILQRELDTTRSLYDGLLQRYKEVSVTDGVATNNVSIIDVAIPPNAPSSPILLLNVAVGILLGLGMGVLGAVLLEALDEGLNTPDDVEAKLGVSVLGAIPVLGKGEDLDAEISNPRSRISEAYYSVGTALQLSTPNGTPRSILVTSSRPAEGKSTTALAISRYLARIGKRVLLIDADLRNPSLHRALGVSNASGMSSLLSGSGDLASVSQRTKLKNLMFIPSGPLPLNPAELWAGNRLRDLLDETTGQFDHIVFDGPPVLGLADAAILGANIDGTVFVLESRVTKRAQARGALARLYAGSKIIGTILTKFDAKSASYGGYDYSYDYNYGSGEPRKS
jgi:capsular exopolysaccharide synthesis family protein